MQYRNITDGRISALGLGGLRFPEQEGRPGIIDRAKAQPIVDAAISCGINCFDTAYSYQDGDSERFLGEALAGYLRDEYLLSTKFYVACSDDIEAVFEEQLERCRTDYFDFYMLHCLDEETIEPYMDKDRDYLGYLIRQKEAGRIRNLGFSSHAKPETLKRFLDRYDKFDMALIQLNYLDWKLLDGCSQYEILKAHNIPVWVMEPMKGGILSVLNEEAAGILKSAAPTASISSWGFRFLHSLDNVQTVLSGMSSVEQVKENAELFDRLRPLDENEMKTLMRAYDVFLRSMGAPCSGCGYCGGICPEGIDIPLMIQAFNEHSVGGETWKIGGLSGAAAASECIGCGACVKRCPQNIQIPEIMRQITQKQGDF